MNKTIVGILGVITAAVLWQTADKWLPQAKAFVQNEIAPPTFRKIKNLFYENGQFNFTAVLNFNNKTPFSVKVTNLKARIFRLVEGNWVLIGETREGDSIQIPA